ncbi:putative branched-chain amino acid permease (azaleucine resistance) [Polynucleobacter duraquae]|jgi:predicted branched-subunit amino acid permease|uniref:Branched-chain amino acid permease (Azaleucine resistance) n=1 Tax=Polynucleobacter duraquae TaxID=1835254 RepID=A0A0E3ZJ36_9BURK|nr:AzlC family ABC transporter permease [Polynucleobacter duraquae]AKD24846.1 putative branched-chain amino acid permease (azaleucine resistance) [Polynucleobacter duraquae]
MSSADQPFIDPSEIKLEASVVQRYKNRSEAFWAGIRDAAGAPAMVLFAGMVGFGAMGKTSGMDAWFTTATSFFMFALPGQVVLLEMAITGSSVIAIALAVTLTSSRFITMTVTLFPQFHEKDRNRGLYASVHLLAMTAWAISMREFQTIEAKHRSSYFIGLGLLCWIISIPGTILGYLLAGVVPPYVTLGLVFINPLFFLLTFAEVKPWINRIAIGLGFILGPFFFLLDRDTSLLTTGLVGGTIAYVFDRKVLRKRAGVIS